MISNRINYFLKIRKFRIEGPAPLTVFPIRGEAMVHLGRTRRRVALSNRPSGD
jgi:hypothetical protein